MLARSLLFSMVRRATSIYFRELEVVGHPPPKETGGRVFAANHTNGLIDPILVLTNTPCPIAPLAKSTLWNVPVLKWILDAVGAVPVQRRVDDPSMKTEANAALFDKSAEHLKSGGNLLIFPEGISHSEPHVVKLKTGAARMLARAHAEGARGLTFQSVGLEFDARDVFRSRALVVYGPVRSVDALAQHEGDLVVAITDQMRADLTELVVEGATWDEHLLIARVAQLFANGQGDRTLAAWNEIGRQVEAARKALGPEDDALYKQIADGIGGYYDALEASGFTDEDVVLHATPSAPTRSTRRRALLALALPFAIPGALLYWLPYRIPRIVTRRIDRAVDRDVVSTQKLATGIIVFPLWAGALTAASFVTLPLPFAVAVTGVVWVSPFAALAWLDHLDQRRIGRRRGGPEQIERLRERRDEAMAILERARERVATRVDGEARARS